MGKKSGLVTESDRALEILGVTCRGFLGKLWEKVTPEKQGVGSAAKDYSSHKSEFLEALRSKLLQVLSLLALLVEKYKY